MLHGKSALHSSMAPDDPATGEMNSLPGLFTKAAANLAAGKWAWEGGQIEPTPACNQAYNVDPMVVCIATSARQRVERLAARYAHQFGQRALKADQSLPEVRNQLRSYYLVMSRIHPTGDLGEPVDPKPVVIAVRADFDGDGKLDTASWRPVDGQWYVEPSTGGPTRTVHLGQSGDQQVAADYNGDAKAEPAVLRPADRRLYRGTLDGGAVSVHDWARPDYRPAPADLPGMVKLAEALTAGAHEHAQAGRSADAVTAQRMSRDLWRTLVTANPVHRASLARASVLLGAYLSSTGGHDEAVTVTKEGVELYRALADRPNLASALNNLAHRLAAAGKPAEAPVPQRESRDLYKELAQTQPAHRPSYAQASVILGAFLTGAGLHDEAITVSRDGVNVYRDLGDRLNLAWALGNLAYRLSAAGKADDAPAPQRESRDLYKALAATNAVYKPDHGRAAVTLGAFLTNARQHDEAITTGKEGVEVYRGIADRPGLAWALWNLAHRYSSAGKPGEAPAPQRESRDIYAELTVTNGIHRPDLANAALLLARYSIAAGKPGDALAAARQAEQEYERLVAENPGKYAAELKVARELRDSLDG